MIYIVRDVITGENVCVTQTEDDAKLMIQNYIKVGEYVQMNYQAFELLPTPVTTVTAIAVSGRRYSDDKWSLKVRVKILSKKTEDMLKFNVAANGIVTYEGIINLEPDELEDKYIGDFRERAKMIISNEFKRRLTNDNDPDGDVPKESEAPPVDDDPWGTKGGQQGQGQQQQQQQQQQTKGH